MFHRSAAVTALCAAALAAGPAPAPAHEGNPNFESIVTDPGPAGLQVRVLSGDDRLEVRNQTGNLVTIQGYEGEPYARLTADGRVQLNQRSPATYLNEDPLGNVDVPKIADPDATPQWKTIESNGRFEFHDHRIHWMGTGDPPSARRNPDARQKVYDWKVPVAVGNQPAAIRGTLWWRGSGGGMPTGAIFTLVALLIGSATLVLLVRRRRHQTDDDQPRQEAW